MRFTRLVLFAATPILLSTPLISAEDYQSTYNEGIQELYTRNNPTAALKIFERASDLDPSQWTPPYMIGYIHRQYLKQADKALPYYQKALKVSGGVEPLPNADMGACMQALERDKEGITYYKKAADLHRARKEEVPAWILENTAWLYFKKGDVEEALRVAPDGMWIKKYLAPKKITVSWRIAFSKALSQWQLADQERVRISLPLDRRYQKVTSLRLSDVSDGTIKKIEARQIKDDGNRYLEIAKGAGYPEALQLEFVVEQSMVSVLPRRPAQMEPVSGASDPAYQYAVESGNGYYSNDNPEMVSTIENAVSGSRSTGEKVERAMEHLRANFKYGTRIADKNVLEMFRSGQGDCGYFSAIAIGFIRSLKVPVRFVYGLNTGYDPPTPHAIIEIYDAKTKQWVPHDPQSGPLYGIINPTYIPLAAYTPDGGWRRGPDGVYEIDTTQFYWAGSNASTMKVTIINQGITEIAKRGGDAPKPPSGVSVPKSEATGSLPGKAGRPR